MPDEAIGIATGFLESGAQGAIGSLWSVDDFATALLMIRFYELLALGAADTRPAEPSVALRSAQLWLAGLDGAELKSYCARHVISPPPDLRRPADELPWRPFSHPYYWAGFQFIGS